MNINPIVGNIISLRPINGCCNSTLCFEEWKVIDSLQEACKTTLKEPVFIVQSLSSQNSFPVSQSQISKILR